MTSSAHKRRMRLVRRAVARLEGLVRLVESQIGSDEHLQQAANEVIEPLLQALGRADRLLLDVGPRAIEFAGEAVSPPAPLDESLAALLYRWKVRRITVGRRLAPSPLLEICTHIARREQLAPGPIILGEPSPESRPVPLDSVQGLLRGYLDDSGSALSAVNDLAAKANVAASDSSLEAWLHQQAAEPPPSPAPERREPPTVPSGSVKRPVLEDPPPRTPRKHMTGNTDVKVEGEHSWMEKLGDSALDTDVNGLLDDLL